MIYSIQLFSEKRTNRRDAFSAERQLVATVKCGELRANGNPIRFALRDLSGKAQFSRERMTFAKVFALKTEKFKSKWVQIEAKSL